MSSFISPCCRQKATDRVGDAAKLENLTYDYPVDDTISQPSYFENYPDRLEEEKSNSNPDCAKIEHDLTVKR